ncbi:hypothetical protein HK104_008507, partial [Borealophlyctis nickersoniae]
MEYEFLQVKTHMEARYFATRGTHLDTVTLSDFLAWHMPVRANLAQLFAKFCTRLDLAFSASVEGISLDEFSVEEDERGEVDGSSGSGADLGQVMTDGNGLIPLSALVALREECGWETVPCAIQDILRVAEARPGYLNYQLIRVLESGGVEVSYFLDLMRAALDNIAGTLWHNDPKVVLAAVEEYGGARWLQDVPGHRRGRSTGEDTEEWDDEERCIYDIAIKLLRAGFHPSENYYLFSLLTRAFQAVTKRLRCKMQIPVPKSRRLLIIPDPTGTLKAGEGYLHVMGTDDSGVTIGTIVGPAVVGRNPAYRPDDMQTVQLVRDSQGVLEPYRNVFVASIQGTQPLAAQLAGGDYDGDDVLVIWDPRVAGEYGYKRPEVEEVNVEDIFKVDERRVQDVLQDSKIGGDNSGGSESGGSETFASALWERFQSYPPDDLGQFTRAHDRCADHFGLNCKSTLELAAICAELLDAEKAGKRLIRKRATQKLQEVKSLESPLWLKAIEGKEEVSPYNEGNMAPPHVEPAIRTALTVLYLEAWKATREKYLGRTEISYGVEMSQDSHLAAPWLRIQKRAGPDTELEIHRALVQMGEVRNNFQRRMGDLFGKKRPLVCEDESSRMDKAGEEEALAQFADIISAFPIHKLPLPWAPADAINGDHSLCLRTSLAYIVGSPPASYAKDGHCLEKDTFVSPLRKWGWPWRIPAVLDALCVIK